MQLPPRPPQTSGPRAGLSIIEVTIALAILMTVLASVSGAFIMNLSAGRRANNLARGSVFLETVMEDLSVQSFDDLPAFDGNRLLDAEKEKAARFAVTLTVFEAQVDLLQVRAVLTDLASGRDIGRLTTMRSAR